MRPALTSFAVFAAALALGACGDQTSTDARPKTFHPTEQAAQTPVMPEDAPPQEEAMSEADTSAAEAVSGAEAACSATLGEAKAAALVKRCIAVSPATHPPCNVQNPCALIQGEIDRSCAMYSPGETKPVECSA